MVSAWHENLDEWLLTLKNLVFPIFCQSCSRRLLTDENGYFCPLCWQASPRIERPFCPVCGQPHAVVAGAYADRLYPCAQCAAEPRQRPYRRILAAAYYQDALADAVKLFKFNGKTRLAGPLGELLAEQLERELFLDRYTRIVPVPLHRVRRRSRGYNQAELLSAEIIALFPHALVDRSLERIRPTRAQSTISDEDERRRNVEGAFAVRPGACFKGEKVLLIDDVVTSGGTVHECARVLRQAGAEYVDVAAVALAVRKPAAPKPARTLPSGKVPLGGGGAV